MKIFLDDYRFPMDCIPYMHSRIDLSNPLNDRIYHQQWRVVKNYPEFVRCIKKHKGNITHVSFDHDLADEHYIQDDQESEIDYNSELFQFDLKKTGYHAAIFLKELYEKKNIDLPIIFVHSMNPVGTQNILDLFGLELL